MPTPFEDPSHSSEPDLDGLELSWKDERKRLDGGMKRGGLGPLPIVLLGAVLCGVLVVTFLRASHSGARNGPQVVKTEEKPVESTLPPPSAYVPPQPGELSGERALPSAGGLPEEGGIARTEPFSAEIEALQPAEEIIPEPAPPLPPPSIPEPEPEPVKPAEIAAVLPPNPLPEADLPPIPEPEPKPEPDPEPKPAPEATSAPKPAPIVVARRIPLPDAAGPADIPQIQPPSTHTQPPKAKRPAIQPQSPRNPPRRQRKVGNTAFTSAGAGGYVSSQPISRTLYAPFARQRKRAMVPGGIAQVTRSEAQDFANWLTQVHRAKGMIGFSEYYRLPSGAEDRNRDNWNTDRRNVSSSERRGFRLVLTGDRPALRATSG